jgi:serine/threonine protein kinase
MAPEQVLGAERVGPATDVYALGTMLYELLTGDPPFLADERNQLFRKVVRDAPRPLRELVPVSEGMEEAVLACLAKDPARRPTMASIRRQLEAGTRNATIPTLLTAPVPRERGRGWRAWQVAAALALVALLGRSGSAVLAAPVPLSLRTAVESERIERAPRTSRVPKQKPPIVRVKKRARDLSLSWRAWLEPRPPVAPRGRAPRRRP